MAKVQVYNLKRESVGELELADDVFGTDVNEGLIYDVLKAQLASRRSGSASTKTRSDVSGSTRKLIRQKGTGGARHGSIRAMLYVGGGKAHGPKPRSYAYEPPRKMRQGAIRSALSLKLKEGALTIVDKFELGEVKTKALAGVLKALQVDKGSLIVDAVGNEKLRLSVRNLPKASFLPPEGVNLYDVLRHPHLVLTKDAVAALQTRLQKA
ncbi:MAG TPA: 50S ribosomal protein L4 [Polyangiales bacterium]|nr:50S ribosomal protein L4 [Polyangiales bacterium]